MPFAAASVAAVELSLATEVRFNRNALVDEGASSDNTVRSYTAAFAFAASAAVLPPKDFATDRVGDGDRPERPVCVSYGVVYRTRQHKL